MKHLVMSPNPLEDGFTLQLKRESTIHVTLRQFGGVTMCNTLLPPLLYHHHSSLPLPFSVQPLPSSTRIPLLCTSPPPPHTAQWCAAAHFGLLMLNPILELPLERIIDREEGSAEDPLYIYVYICICVYVGVTVSQSVCVCVCVCV